MTGACCTACGKAQVAGAWRCTCGGVLDLPDIAASALATLPAPDRGGPGIWRYATTIPVSAEIGSTLSMGEGWTPLVTGGADLPRISIKVEFASPTLSFKDRGAAVLVAAALERGTAGRLVADSSGNAGSAIAAYAARAGLECTVFMPQRTSSRKQAQARAYGASLELVGGDRTAVSEAAIAEVRRTGATYASHVYDPFFLQGTKTFAFEVWEQLRGAPDALVLPVGNGTLLLGVLRGFRELHAAGLIERAPAVVAVQSENCAPLACGWATGEPAPCEVDATATVAEGIAIPRPPRGRQILAEIRDSGGCVVAVPEAAIMPAQLDLGRRGFYVEPTAALTWAGALLARRHAAVAGCAVEGAAWHRARELVRGSVVVPLCGSGLKAA